jgi:outer membrane protein OmpA-like peptidoglycan-associated protein
LNTFERLELLAILLQSRYSGVTRLGEYTAWAYKGIQVQRNKGNHKGIPNKMNKKAFLAAAAILALAACSGQDLGTARNTAANSSDYGNALSAGYLRLAQAEYSETDYGDSDYFAQRSIEAGTAGSNVTPPPATSRNLPQGDAIYVATAHNELMEVLNAGAAEKAPQLAATAVVAYECWIQELEENTQLAHITACQDQLDGLIPALRNAVAAPAAKAKPKRVKGKSFKVFFGAGSAKLDDAANKVIVAAAAHAKKYKQVRVAVSGYSDTAGGAAGNRALSERRAAVVAAALRIRGVPRTEIKTNGYGEAFGDVRTPDGVSEPKNRRVEIGVGGK